MLGDSNSPNRRKNGGSPNFKKSVSPNKKAAANVLEKSGSNKAKEEQKGLSSPTSISMYNSFIIKNADESFD